jgi:flagellar biosynthesis/type III secretory pathway protein FliH
MSDLYVPLATFLRPVRPPDSREPTPPPTQVEVSILPVSQEEEEALRAVRRFRAALTDALEVAVNALLPMIARDVLGRELRLGRADVAAIITAALRRFAGERVLCVRANPRDCDALAGLDLERIADDALEPGDVRVDLHSGTIDLTLETRLDAALRALP